MVSLRDGAGLAVLSGAPGAEGESFEAVSFETFSAAFPCAEYS